MYEYPFAVVLRIIVYSTRMGKVLPDTFVKRPDVWDRPIVPIVCVPSEVPH
jgi:hypothetical protein